MEHLHSRILDAKEELSMQQMKLIGEQKCPIISVTLNLPNKEKEAWFHKDMLRHTVALLQDMCRQKAISIKEERWIELPIGFAHLIAVAVSAETIKACCIEVEEQANYGRLMDLDVIGLDGFPVGRSGLGYPKRKCWVCEKPAAECVRAKSHTYDEVAAAYQGLVNNFLASQTKAMPDCVTELAEMAVEAMLMEVISAPTPGLVNRFHSGAHKDMDVFTFMKSTAALISFMERFAMAGWLHKGELPSLVPVLQRIGIEAEAKMFGATGGINTHKGMIFLMGFVVATLGYLKRNHQHVSDILFVHTMQTLCKGIVEQDLESLKTQGKPPRSIGEKLYLEYGLSGVRGEVEAGLPAVFQKGIPALEEGKNEGLSVNDGLVHCLIALMAVTEDTTILHRNPLAVLEEVQRTSKEICALGGMKTKEGRQRIEQLDEEMIARRISPGGSADLVAVSYFLHQLLD